MKITTYSLRATKNTTPIHDDLSITAQIEQLNKLLAENGRSIDRWEVKCLMEQEIKAADIDYFGVEVIAEEFDCEEDDG